MRQSYLTSRKMDHGEELTTLQVPEGIGAGDLRRPLITLAIFGTPVPSPAVMLSRFGFNDLDCRPGG
jgi:hypothetical protein